MSGKKLTSAYRPHNRVQLTCSDHSLAKQSFQEECDINNIVRRHSETGILTHVNNRSPSYNEYISSPDYHTALNQIMDAQNSFNELPSAIRSQFNNDPAQFLDFVQDPDNEQDLVDMGLAFQRPPEPSPEPSAPTQLDLEDKPSEVPAQPST